jgi:hypothetical protein
MSLRARERASGHRPAEAETYRRQFVVMVHRILAGGFAALRSRSSDLAAKEETAITGLLVDQMQLLLESRRCPRGAEHFAVHDDRPESAQGIEGKRRPRIDLFVERTGRGPRPKFHFEAKRLNAGSSVAAYVGAEGLGRFLSGKYAKDAPDAGMLGYVQDDFPGTWADRIEKKLDSERAQHGLPPAGEVWEAHSLVKELAYSYRATHTREGRPFQVFHVLLACA